MYVIRKKDVSTSAGEMYYYRKHEFTVGFACITDPFSATQFDTEATAKLTGDKLGLGEYEVVELRSLLDAPK